MQVSVIIPTYKRSEMLGRAIESVLKQTYQDFEILVVDDNNPDTVFRKDTEIFMKKYESNPKIRYIKREVNGGGAAARNTGIKEAKGAYIAFLDDDDEYLDTFLEKQVKNLNENDIDVSVCGSVTYKGSKIENKKEYLDFDQYPDKMVYHVVNMIIGTQTFMIRKELLDTINGFSVVPAGQEYVLMYRMIEAGAKIGVVKENLTNIYIHEQERISVGKNKLVAEKMLLKMKKKYFDRLTFKQKHHIIFRYFSIMFITSFKVKKYFSALKYLLLSLITNPIRTFKSFVKKVSV